MVTKNLIKVHYVFLVFTVVLTSMADCPFVARGSTITGKSVPVLITDPTILTRIRGTPKNICTVNNEKIVISY